MEEIGTSAERTRRWRQGIRQRRVPEVDDLDTAAATALAIYIAREAGSGDPTRVALSEGLQAVVVAALKGAGYCADESARRIENRVFYLQQVSRHPDASAANKRRWELGPMPADFDIPDAMGDVPDDIGFYDPQDEDGYND
jgi:hypothetical protein